MWFLHLPLRIARGREGVANNLALAEPLYRDAQAVSKLDRVKIADIEHTAHHLQQQAHDTLTAVERFHYRG